MGEGPTAKPATWPAPVEMFGQGELRAAAPRAQARGWHQALRRGLEFSQSCASASRKREVYPQPRATHADFALPYSGMGRVHPGPAHGWGERGACWRMRHRSAITDPPHGRSGESLCARAQQELLHCCFGPPVKIFLSPLVVRQQLSNPAQEPGMVFVLAWANLDHINAVQHQHMATASTRKSLNPGLPDTRRMHKKICRSLLALFLHTAIYHCFETDALKSQVSQAPC